MIDGPLLQVLCDECDNISHTFPDNEVEAALNSLEAQGWALEEDNLCPVCTGKVAEIKPATHLIVQRGGSACEWLSEACNSLDEAETSIKAHKAATYNAIGPFEISERLAEALVEVPGAMEDFLVLMDDALRDAVMGDFSSIEPDSCPKCGNAVGPEDMTCDECDAALDGTEK